MSESKTDSRVFSPTHSGWDTKDHLELFDGWNKIGRFEFIFRYGNFEELKYLKEKIKKYHNPTVLDFGCATGTTNRFLRLIAKKQSYLYKGVDISSQAIERAKELYEESEFELINENSNFLNKNKYDIVFSRDTVLHQKDPYGFLKSLINATRKSLILRLRTRDKGKTILDIDQSCQMHYENFWMPYIVLNIDELVDFLIKIERVYSIRINKSYEQLGGFNKRYLPKDLYYEKTGTAETSVLIDLSEQPTNEKKKLIIQSNLEGHAFIRKNKIKAIIHRIITKAIKKITP